VLFRHLNFDLFDLNIDLSIFLVDYILSFLTFFWFLGIFLTFFSL
jgi:hypothetical protein